MMGLLADKSSLQLPRLVWITLVLLLASCARSGTAPAAQPLPAEITLYDWAGDMPQSVLDSFYTEYGIKVKYLTYGSTEEACQTIEAGGIYDVAVLENRCIPSLVNAGVLAHLTPSLVPNFKNISPDFRDLVYDPGNHYAIPFNWGTTGLVVRADLLEKPPTRWSDLWEDEKSGKIGLWRGEPRDTLGMALKSLGYSANSESPAELEAALSRLMEIRPRVVFLEDLDVYSAALPLAKGKITSAVGYGYDALEGLQAHPSIQYVLPQEGGLMWGDNFTIPVSSLHPQAAALLINFFLRPEISAQIANYNRYATPNQAAFPFIKPDIRNNPIIFPPDLSLQNAEIILPLSLEGERLYSDIWNRFLDSNL